MRMAVAPTGLRGSLSSRETASPAEGCVGARGGALLQRESMPRATRRTARAAARTHPALPAAAAPGAVAPG